VSPGLYEGSVVRSRFGIKCGVGVGAGSGALGAGAGASRGGQGGASAKRILVVTTEGSDERVLVPEHGRGIHREEMGELGEAGRSRNAHRVAERVGGGKFGMELWKKIKRKRRHRTDAGRSLIICRAEGHGVWVVGPLVAVTREIETWLAS
jgi:hypothetical protein